MPLSYVLPIRTAAPRADLALYLRWLAERVEVIVVDGSDPDVFERHAGAFGPTVRHVPVDPARVTAMGKVGGVMTGVVLAAHDHVVIADEDVVYTEAELQRVDRWLDEVDVVRPQNWFDALPWHARWDTGRILLNRMTGGDWPGTLGVRRSTLLPAGGYAGDVLFENLELVRTIEAAGGRSAVDLGLLVRRRPPGTSQFLDQRVRQAYDELARPWRLLAHLAVIPFVAATGPRGAAALAAGTMAVAEAGRRRSGGRRVFPPTSALSAPLWMAERSVTSWLALASRLCLGGVRYRDGILPRAATPARELRQQVAAMAEASRSAAPSAKVRNSDGSVSSSSSSSGRPAASVTTSTRA